jgi:hypothetical protein
MADVMCHGAVNWVNFIVLIYTVDSTPKKRIALLQKQNSLPSIWKYRAIKC